MACSICDKHPTLHRYILYAFSHEHEMYIVYVILLKTTTINIPTFSLRHQTYVNPIFPRLLLYIRKKIRLKTDKIKVVQTHVWHCTYVAK